MHTFVQGFMVGFIRQRGRWSNKEAKMELFFNKKGRVDAEEERYRDLYEEYTGRRPDHKLTEDEKIELEMFDEDMWNEEDY